MSLCVHNAQLVTSAMVARGGVLVSDDGRIEAVLKAGDAPRADIVIDARERMLFPGFVDAHVHMRDPGLTHKEDFGTGTHAAACGGVTTIMCMPNVNPPIENPAAVAAARAAGTGRAYVDFAIQGSITPANIDLLPEIWRCGITSFEIGLSDGAEGIRVSRMDDPAVLFRALEVVASIDGVVGIYTGCQPLTSAAIERLRAAGRIDLLAHAEARPPITEALGLAMMLELARATAARVVCRQVCTRRGYEIVRRAKTELPPGRIGVEATPHNLCLTIDKLDQVGRYGQIVPPLRSEDDRRATVEALVDGTVDFVGSDHAPHAVEEKNRPSAWESRNGSPGLDTIVPAVLDLAAQGIISFSRVAQALAERPAILFGLGDRKGVIAPGADGDLVLVDPDAERTVTPSVIHSKMKHSVFQDERLRGWPVLTILRGHVIAEAGALVGSPVGQFVARGALPPI